MNRRLLEVARSEKPVLLFSLLFQDEFEKRTIRAVSESGETQTLNWFCDDHWRFDSYSRYWAPASTGSSQPLRAPAGSMKISAIPTS